MQTSILDYTPAESCAGWDRELRERKALMAVVHANKSHNRNFLLRLARAQFGAVLVNKQIRHCAQFAGGTQ